MLAVVRGTKQTRYGDLEVLTMYSVQLMFTVFCRARCYLVILFCDVSFQGSFSYSNCACAAKTGQTTGEAKKGICAVDCGLNRMIFLAILGFLPFMTFMNGTPGYIVTLRFVMCNFNNHNNKDLCCTRSCKLLLYF